MKLFKLFAAAAACIALFASCNPEGKGEQKEDYSAIQKQLAGTWEGELKTIMIVNGEEKELGSTKVVLTFTDKTMTRKDGEEVALTYDYVLKKDSSKGYYFVCSLMGEEIGAIWFEVNGSTLSLTGGDGTFFMTFPKTFTKK